MMLKKSRQSFLQSVRCAFLGFWYVLEERNFRIQAFCGVAALVLAFIFHLSHFDRIIIGALVVLVLGAEMLNSALERFIDFHVKDHNPEVGKIKDISAGAVLLFSLFALIVGICIFGRALFTF